MIIDIIFALFILTIVLAYLWYVKKDNEKHTQPEAIKPFLHLVAKAQDNQNNTLFSHDAKEPNQTIEKPSNKNEAPPYRCVVIKTGMQTCEQVRALGSKPILLSEAPLLPLTGCNVRKCQCKFNRHDDRRMTDRRTFFGAAKEIIENHSNKRERPDRRKTPHAY